MNTPNYILQNPIEYLKGVGPQKADILKKEIFIFTFGDLLQLFPFRYVDRTSIIPINKINNNTQYVQVKGTLMNPMIVGEKNAKRLVALLDDGTGAVELVWFQGIRWMEKLLQVNKEYIVFGKPSIFKNRYSFTHPDIELAGTDKSANTAGKMQPVYPSTEKLKTRGLDTKGIARLTHTLLNQLSEKDIPEILPTAIVKQYQFISRWKAIHAIHFPENENQLELARRRMKYEELFLLQMKILHAKLGRKKQHSTFVFSKIGERFNSFYNHTLPAPLTGAQKKVVKEIRADLVSGIQMNRLLQGDVGSGKTWVALMSMLIAADNQFQSCLMAPTEILARQHFETFSQLTSNLNMKVKLLTAAVKGKQRKEILLQLASGEIDILIGTHSLIEDAVQFSNLGLVVIDEQHRFGVEQRARLWTKNHQTPHVLVMTATPIPRTLAMTLYGDLDVSVIDELPPGRKPVKTVHRFESARLGLFGFMREQIKLGRQIYVVYPLIEESEKSDYADLVAGYENLSREFPLPHYKIGVLHGRMKAEEKDIEMKRFQNNETQILVSTTVIEVGVNIPNASVMVIESSEKFGLSQLHQLRGRVGRGADQSFCILMTGNKLSNDAKTRIETMCRTNDGFEIAEVDLSLRGPGNIEGTQQSGIVNLRLADLAKDQTLLQQARTDAEKILNQDPTLESENHRALKSFLKSDIRTKQQWGKIS